MRSHAKQLLYIYTKNYYVRKQFVEKLTSKGESQARETHELSELPLSRGFVLCGLEV